MEEDAAVTAYRTTDPLENVLLKVRLKRVSGREQQAEAVEEVQDFRWQQKLFSRSEEKQYSEPLPCPSPLEQRYHRLLCDQMRANNGHRPNSRLFSYTEEDIPGGRVPDDQAPLTTAVSERVTNPVRLRPGVRRRHGVRGGPVVERPTVDQQAQSRVLTPPPHTMFIMADLGEGECGGDEHQLCQVKVCLGGVVSFSPDLSQGSKWYRVESEGGELFEYRVEHASAEISREEQCREDRIAAELSKQRTQHLRGLAGSSFEDPPCDEGSVRVQVVGELVSGRGFAYDDLYVAVTLDLPEGGVCTSPEEAGQTTVSQVCRTKSAYLEDVAHFCLPLDYQLELPVCSGVLCPPVLCFEVQSLDAWDRHRTEGYGQWQIPATPGYYDVTVATWRPLGQTLIDELRRVFIGGGPQLEDVVSVGVKSGVTGPAPAAKYGLRSQSSGSLHLRLSVAHQSSAIQRRNWCRLPRALSRGSALSTEATLDMYRRVKARLKAGEPLPQHTPPQPPLAGLCRESSP